MVLRGTGKRFIIPVTIVLLVVAVVGVLAAGCGSGAATTTTAPASTTTAVSSPTDTSGGQTTSTASQGTGTTAAALSASLNGAGATFPNPVYVAWIGGFQKTQPGVTVNYQAVGSGAGITQFTQMTVDFGASDAPMKDAEIAAAEQASAAKVLHIPMVFGAITVSYNLPGVDNLKLDSDTLAGIFLGSITTWNDPKITALNAGVTLPGTAIQTVHRSDSSGTTANFTAYLDAVNPDWHSKVGTGKTVKWPVGVGANGNDGVAAAVKQTAGAIGYIELSYAVTNKIPVVSLENKSGNFVTPTLDSTVAATAGVTFPDDLRFSVMNSVGAEAYPIVTATWILAYDKMKDPAKAAALKAYLTWCLISGDSIAQGLGYAPLPDTLKTAALAKVNAIGS